MRVMEDFTSGDNILKKLIFFSIPLLFSYLLESLYNVADMVIAGQFIGSSAISALGNASTIIWVVNALILGFTVGGSVLVSQYNGAKDYKALKNLIFMLISIVASIAILLTITNTLLYGKIFKSMAIPTDALKQANDYFLIIGFGWIFIFVNNCIAAIMRGLGNSKYAFYFIVISFLVNVILDIVFVAVFNMGIAGTALSTVIAEILSCILSLIFLKKMWSKKSSDFKSEVNPKKISLKKRLYFFNIQDLKRILRIGVPVAIQVVVINLSFIFLTIRLNAYGINVSSASGIGSKIIFLISAPSLAIGQAVSAMVGQNAGAGEIQRIKKIAKTGVFLAFFIAIFLFLLTQIFAQSIVSLFDQDSEVIENGIFYLRICSLNCITYSIMFIFNLFSTGLGNSKLGLFNALVDAVLIKCVLCLILESIFGLEITGIYAAVAFSSFIPAIIGFIYFKSNVWENRVHKIQLQRRKI